MAGAVVVVAGLLLGLFSAPLEFGVFLNNLLLLIIKFFVVLTYFIFVENYPCVARMLLFFFN